MNGALVKSILFLVISSIICLVPALVVGALVYWIDSEYEGIAMGVVFGFLLTELIFRRKSKWLG